MNAEAAAAAAAQNAVSLKAEFDRNGRNVDELIKYVAGTLAAYQESARENRRMLMDLLTQVNRNNQPEFVS